MTAEASPGPGETPEALSEFDSIFCANLNCLLHVRPGDPNVRGWGNWAVLADGIIVGRQRVESIMLCDRCAEQVKSGAVRLEIDRRPAA